MELTVLLFVVLAAMTGLLVVITVQLKNDVSQAISAWRDEKDEAAGKLLGVAGEIVSLLNELRKRSGNNPGSDQVRSSADVDAKAFEAMVHGLGERLERLETGVNELSRFLLEAKDSDGDARGSQRRTPAVVRREAPTMAMGMDQLPTQVRDRDAIDEWPRIEEETRRLRDQVSHLIRQGYSPDHREVQKFLVMLKAKEIVPIIPEKGYPYRRRPDVIPVDVHSEGSPGQIVGINRVGWMYRGRTVVCAEVQRASPREDAS